MANSEMKSPLLQEPLPVMRKHLPDIYLIHDRANSLHMLEVEGIGKRPVPDMVLEAIKELDNMGMWQEMGYHCIGKVSQPSVKPRPDIALLALMLRYEEMNYTSFIKC
jgi:hypothetical protein